jgi:peptidoglycan/xylan/chitin deacetylase (PgdA/CDA1 family)
LLIVVFVGIYLLVQKQVESLVQGTGPRDRFESINKPVVTPTPKPTPVPTPKPLTFAQMNDLYGPCVHLPVLMYHHIQTQAAAQADKQQSLTVYTNIFQSQMQYLKSKGYNVLTMNDLVNFFDAGTPVPAKSVLLTFDDGYQDFYTDAYPVLSGLGFHATMFVPTGLVENPDYLTWGEISGMNSWVLFANHTWSHANVQISTQKMQYEISTADAQLSSHGLNSPKVFAYPYGFDSTLAENYLSSLGYKAAFTTTPGSVLCKRQRFNLPRLRIGNSSLSSYGF